MENNLYTNVHMDFHTPALQREVGGNFDPDKFSQELEKSEVSSITFFAKGHHGYSYYDTEIGVKHPNLKRNLLKEVVEVCHERDVIVLAYYSLVWDNYLGEQYKDWVQRDKEGNILTSKNFARMGKDEVWSYLCLNSPYPEELIYPQIKEIAELGVDGFFFDILQYYPRACTCKYCMAEMQQRGLDPGNDKALAELRKETTLNFAETTTNFVKQLDDRLIITYNHKEQAGYSSKLAQHCDYLLIESLPVQWGYLHAPYVTRYIRTLDKPFQGMTGIFHRSWGDFGSIKHENQLKYEVATSVSHGAMISIGDHIPPRCDLDDSKYETIGEAFRFAEERKDLLFKAKPVAEVAVIAKDGDDPARVSTATSVVGASKALIESHFVFDIIDSSTSDKLKSYQILVLPSEQELDEDFADKIDQFVKGGGKLVVLNTGGVKGGSFLLDSLGVSYHSLSPYSFSYLQLPENLSHGIPGGPMISYFPMVQVQPEEARVIGGAMVPATERFKDRGYSHRQAPPENDSPYPGMTVNRYGKGEAIYVAHALCADYYEHDYYGHRVFLNNLLARYLPNGRKIETDAPENVEFSLLKKEEKEILNLINYTLKKPGNTEPQIEKIVPIYDINISISTNKKPRKVKLHPENRELEFSFKDSRVKMILDKLDLHSMIVLEY